MAYSMFFPWFTPTTGALALWQCDEEQSSLDDACLDIAAGILRTRLMRARYLADYSLAEPVWDMLLDLYVAEARGRRVSVLDLAIAVGVPRSTGLRCVARLVAEGKLERCGDPRDKRRTWLTLARQARADLHNYLTALAVSSR